MPRRRRRRPLVTLLAIVAVVVAIVGVLFARGLSPVGPGQKAIVSVRANDTVATVLPKLQAHHAIRSARWARLYAALTGTQNHRLVPGLYEISPLQSTPDILKGLVARLGAVERITVPEGRNVRWIAALMDRKRICTRTEFLDVCSSPRAAADGTGLTVPTSSLEGYLFPDTYYMAQNLGAKKAAAMMLLNFQKRALAAGLLKSDHLTQTVTIASMIELEAKVPKDRPLIAGVIRNRLAKNMPLEIDACVLYGLHTWKDRVLLSDLSRDTPYNTYKHTGLPPTPICNPGIASLLAAAKPAQHGYLYYVARGDGSHAFSATYDDFLHNKRLLQQHRAQAH